MKIEKILIVLLLGVSSLSAKNKGTYTNYTMTWPPGSGITRYYQVYTPPVCAPSCPSTLPLVVMLHGTRTTATFTPLAITSLEWGWNVPAEENNFILVTPASTYDTSSHQWNWNAYFMNASFPAKGGYGAPPDDSGFLRNLIVTLTAEFSVNPNMVYVAGFSSGAQMAERVGVEISDLVAAIIPESGQMEGQQAAPPPVLVPGNALQPVSVQEWQGTLDTGLPPCGYGTTRYSGVLYYLDTVDDTFNYWTGSLANNCTEFQTTQPLCLNGSPNYANDAPTPGLSGFTGNIATGCTNNVEVQFIWEVGDGHANESQYDNLRWQFFANHPKQPVLSQ
ncbi:MAG: PHB depolymerase family esterase [Terriglobales bacterium]